VKLEGNLMWTRMLKFERVFPDGSRYSYEGTHGPRGLSSASGTPKDRGSLEFTLSKSSLSATARVNYVGGMRMVDNNQSTITYTATVAGKNYYNVAEGFSYPVADPSVVCGVYNPDGTAPNGCQLPSLTTLDLFGKWSFNKETAVTLGVKNVLNKLAPLDPYTYGGYNYNSGFHQDGAVGRFMTFGIKYKF
jgi:iron complex outermembrane receptor protein